MEKSLKKNFFLPGINGGQVQSDRAFHTMKVFFEELISKNPGYQYINATEGGARIEGAEALPLETVIGRFCLRFINVDGQIESYLAKPGRFDAVSFHKEMMSVNDDIIDMLATAITVQKDAQIALKTISAVQESGKKVNGFNELPQDLVRQINDINRNVGRLDASKKIWELLEEVTLQGVKESEQMQSVILKLSGKPELFFDYLVKSFERLEFINNFRIKILSSFKELVQSVICHFEKESELKKKIEEEGEHRENLFPLACHYFNKGDLIRSFPLIKRLIREMPYSSELNFFLGCIYSHFTAYDKAADYFEKAMKKDGSFKERLTVFKKGLGDEYADISAYFKNHDHDVYRRMLLKGLKYCNDHPGLLNAFKSLAEEDLETIKISVQKGDLKNAKHILKAWIIDFKGEDLLQYFPMNLLADMHCYYGNVLVSEEDLLGAKKYFTEAINIIGSNPQYHFFLADVHFALNDYDKGKECLKRAVSLNKSFAKYWENMGDNLFRQAKFRDARESYELCFDNLPDKADLLNKIAKCCEQLGESDKAAEYFKKYKSRVK